MAITAITQVTEEGVATSISAFLKDGQLFLAWAIANAGLYSSVRWKLHSSAYFTEVVGDKVDFFKDISALHSPGTNTIVVAYTDSDSVSDTTTDQSIFVIGFHPTTGAVQFGPVKVGPGMKPKLLHRNGEVGERMLLFYSSRKRGSVYLRESEDGGRTWTGERPVLNNYVRSTMDIAVASFDDEHVSILQVGLDAKPIIELGSLTRTRPLAAIVKHPLLANRVIVAEPNYHVGKITEYVWNSLVVVGDKMYSDDVERLGADDGIGSFALLDVSGIVPTVQKSVTPVFENFPSDNFASFDLSVDISNIGTPFDMFGASSGVPVRMAASPTHVYVAARDDSATVFGGFGVVRLSDLAAAYPINGEVPNCRAVGVGTPPAGTPLIFLGLREAGGERLRIYEENGLTPTLRATHKMPAECQHIFAVMESATQGLIYISMKDRFNVYRLDGLAAPIRLVMTTPILTKGSFYEAKLAPNGNIVCAAGAAGVMVLNPFGGVVAGTILSGIVAPTWRGGKAYSLNDIVVPTEKSAYSAQRKYFRCSQAGTSGAMEPSWSPLAYATVVDNTARWQEVGGTDAIATGVEIDPAAQRIYVVGLAGGMQSTTGRVWILDGKGLLT